MKRLMEKMKSFYREGVRKGMKLKLACVIIGVMGLFLYTLPAFGRILDGWVLDLSGINPYLGNHINIDRLVGSGGGTITQYYGEDGQFNNGDPFTESLSLTVLNYYVEPGGVNDIRTLDLYDDSTDTQYYLRIDAIGLSGYVYKVENKNTPSDISDDSFNYVFTPGGLVTVSLVDDLENPNPDNTINLAILTVVSPSGGQGPDGYLGGQGVNGTSDLTLQFVGAYPGVWKTSDGLDFSDLPIGYFALGLYNGHNTIPQGALTPIPNGFEASVESGGNMKTALIPEPTSLLLLGGGLLGLAGIGIRRKKKLAR